MCLRDHCTRSTGRHSKLSPGSQDSGTGRSRLGPHNTCWHTKGLAGAEKQAGAISYKVFPFFGKSFKHSQNISIAACFNCPVNPFLFHTKRQRLEAATTAQPSLYISESWKSLALPKKNIILNGFWATTETCHNTGKKNGFFWGGGEG